MSGNLSDTVHHRGGSRKSSNNSNNNTKQRRPRLRLNCGECRSKKLSCDRNLPCQRCIRAGRPEQCSYESFPPSALSLSSMNNSSIVGQQQDNDQIRELRAEVDQLKQHLGLGLLSATTHNVQNATRAPDTVADFGSPAAAEIFDRAQSDQGLTSSTPIPAIHRDRSSCPVKGPYAHPTTVFQFFHETPQLLHFVKEVSKISSDRLGTKSGGIKITGNSEPEETQLADLLPPKDDADVLVSFYLEHSEHIHRIVHIPTFKHDYLNFWMQERHSRHPAIAALILCMAAIAISASTNSSDTSGYRTKVPGWIAACDKWVDQQRQQDRNLVYYQISCLIYLARRMSSNQSRPHWKETGSLMQDAIMDRLHNDPPGTDSPYTREMNRRIWAVLRELDLQNSFEFGLPSLLHTLESTTCAPENLDDDEFDENSKIPPFSKPSSYYTRTSYQSLSARSWGLRLDISRRLFSAGRPQPNTLSHDEALRYTHQITQALDSLPRWTVESGASGEDECVVRKVTLLSWAFLQFQLKECLLAIHRPYLHRGSRMYTFSEMICYHAAKEVLLFNRKLAVLGTQGLTMLREDLMVACLILCRVTVERPKGTISVPITNAISTISLFEDCVPFMEGRYLRSLYGEPWRALAIYAALETIGIHVGKRDFSEAASCASNRFVATYQEHIARQFEQPQEGTVPTVFEAYGVPGGVYKNGDWNFADSPIDFS